MNTQRSALVTGGASGIGLATARAFIAQGMRVMLVDVNDRVHAVAQGLSTAAAPVHGHQADLSDEKQVLGAAAAVNQLFGGCDVLFNCAGISLKRNGLPIPPTELTSAEWQKVLFINLTAPFLLCRELLPGMQANKFGRIINIASRAGRTYVAPAGVEYATAKAGLIGLTRHLGGTYAPYGITVNAIAPGRVETPLANLSSRETIAASLKSIPAARQGTTDEIAATAVFLASDGASYITGTCIDVNGGAFIG